MFNLISKTYLFIAILFYIIMSYKISGEHLLINFINFLSVIAYFGILYINFHLNKRNYKRNYLAIEVFVYSLFFIFMYNFISFYYTGDFFLFSKADAFFYHKETIEVLTMPIGKAIDYYLSYMGTDDLGMILVLYPLYHIAESNIILNLLYLVIGVITSLNIFSISQNFMTKRYAFLASISYSLSSFVLFFDSSGLKESFMIFLIISSYNYYYKFLKSKNILYILVSLLFISSLLLFRPAISAMIIASIGISSFFQKKSGIGIKIFALFLIVFLVSIADDLISIFSHYMGGGGFDMLIYARESQGMIIGSLPFTYSVNILAQLIGPLPTLMSENKIMLTFFAPGLIYRVFISFPFWLGVLYIYKKKVYRLYPLVFFVIMEMASLATILEGLELRKSLPHIGLVFIIAFWFMNQYDSKKNIIKKRKKFKLFFKFSIFLLSIMILYWNFK